MTQPSFSCPRCGYETFLPSDIAAGYCPSCRWWTGDSLLGSEDVMEQNAIDGPLSIVPVVEDLTRLDVEAEWFIDHDSEPFGVEVRHELGTSDVRVDGVELEPGDAYLYLSSHGGASNGVYRITSAPTYRVARFVRALRRFRR